MFKFIQGRLLEKISLTFFLLLFPGFFIYHVSIGLGLIPPFFGGYWGVTTIFAVILFTIFGAKQFFKNNSLAQKIFYLILSINLIVSLAAFAFDTPAGYSFDMFAWSMAGIVANVAVFMVGRNFNAKYSNYSGTLTIFLTAVIIYYSRNTAVFDPRYLSKFQDVEAIASYQGLARSFLFVALVASAANFKSSRWYYIYSIAGLLGLFMIGSRSEFMVFIASIIILYFMYIKNDLRLILQFLLLAGVSVAAILILDGFHPELRIFDVMGVFHSESGLARSELNRLAFNDVFGGVFSMVFGNYGGYVKYGGIGSYPHNIFSAWYNFGIVGILLFLSLFAILWRDFFKWFDMYGSDPLFKIFSIFLISATLLFLFSKEYTDVSLALAVGLHWGIFARTIKK